MTQIWDCTDARLSLGVYVLGAIDPAERSLVDAHLVTCRDCRDELAGLAGLPALLARVNPDEISRITSEDTVRTATDALAPPLPVASTVSQCVPGSPTGTGTVRVVVIELSPPNRPPAMATTAAAAARKRQRVRRRLASARSSTVPISSPGGRSSAPA